MSFQSATVRGALSLAVLTLCSLSVSAADAKTVQTDALCSSEQQVGKKTFQVSQLVIDATPERVQGVLDDYDNAPKYFSNVKKCRVVKENGGTKDVAFTVSTMSNLWTLDYVLELSEHPGLIQWHRLKGAFRSNEGYWKMEPVNNGHSTLVTYAKCIEGGPFVPQSLVVREVKACMPQVMENLKMAAESQSKVAIR